MGYCKYCHIAYRNIKTNNTLCGYCKRKTSACSDCGKILNKKNIIDNKCLQCNSNKNQCIKCNRRYHITLSDHKICKCCQRNTFPIIFPTKTITLNSEQSQIIKHSLSQNAVLLACAGSGKTTTLVSKIAYMIHYQNVKPNEIILTTFTRHASKEMKSRLKTLLNTETLPIICGTFHSIALTILKKYSPDSINDLFHIDELQYRFYKFLQTESADQLKSQIKYLFVDEYQDINKIQYEIIKSFNSTLIAVGDDGQNIYTFRGSNVSYILNFQTLFQDSKRYMLSRNYRSCKPIISIANRSINKNPNQHPKDMISNRDDLKIKPSIHFFDSMYKEIEWIVADILNLLDSDHPPPLSEIAILTRNGSPLYFIEEALAKENIYSLLLMSKTQQTSKKENLITLSTIHSSKGLEWSHIYLMGFNDQFFPSDKDLIEEERRLFYVAVTRCKEILKISYSKDKKYLCRFITELPRSLFNFSDLERPFNFEKTFNSDIEFKNSVTSIIESLDGEDYIKLRDLNIIREFDFSVQKIHGRYKYLNFIDQKNIYAEFGIFVDYLLRRMTNCYVDQKADRIIESLPLKAKDLDQYNKIYDQIKDYDQSQLLNFNKCKDLMWIKRAIWKMNKFGYKCFSDLMISNRFYLPNNFIKGMEGAYIKYKNPKNNWRSIIDDIYKVSKAHSISFNRRAVLYKGVLSSDLRRYMPMYENCEKFIKDKIQNSDHIETSPQFKTERIIGEGDLLIDDLLIDFKVHNGSALEMNNVAQLLAYTSLGRSLGYKINRIGLYNPLMGEYCEADISGWNKEREFLEYLITRMR